MTISVRRLFAEDAAALRELRLESLRLHPEYFGADLEAEEAMSVEDMTARMATGLSFGGFVDGQLAGLVVFVKPNRRKTGHTGELGAMYVRANARGKGLGDALVEAVVAYATGKVEQVKLTVNAENKHAIALYERHGFKEIGRYPNSIRVGQRSYDELIMLQFLPS
ncbi:MAG TPA: N-acetyltransferase [Candidatus Acidoferrales bacterium]|nr:N-acetyltransferase [Candidatus Acidoferrales bacterium]